MPEEPEQMLPQERTTSAADRHRHAIHYQTAWQKKAGMRKSIHQLHDDRRFERRERQEQQKRGDKLRPHKKRKSHPGQPFGTQLNDCGDEIDGAEQRRRNQKNKSDQPEGLAVEYWIMSRTAIRDCRKRRIGSPATLRRAAGHEETEEHDDAANSERPKTCSVHFREGHVRRAYLQRHDEISECRKCQP